MDWVKLHTDYYRDVEVAVGSDAAEVMFVRGMALAGEIEQSGFLPDAMIPGLTRKPGQAARLAGELVKADLWVRVKGGYQIVNFARINAELERLVERKRRDRDRKRRERALSADGSSDGHEDSPSDGHEDSLYESERKTKKKTAAAAAAPAAAADRDVSIEILADKLRQHTALRALRTDKLSEDQTAALVELIAKHGDQRLVDQALAAMRRDDPPRTIQAFLPGWLVMPAPGQRLAVVQAPPCPQPGHSGTTLHCAQCASEQKAAR